MNTSKEGDRLLAVESQERVDSAKKLIRVARRDLFRAHTCDEFYIARQALDFGKFALAEAERQEEVRWRERLSRAGY